MALTQYAYLFQNDDGTESGASDIGTESNSISLTPGLSARIRIGINATGDPTPKQFQLEFRHKPLGGSFTTWAAVPLTFWNTFATSFWSTAVTTYWNKTLNSGAA